MKQVFRLSVAIIALILVACASSAFAQTPSPSVDPFIAQITSSAQNSFAGGISGDGRLVVFESNGDIATKDAGLSLNPDNSDGNREIFLLDYAQRRIFQITNTKSALKNTSGSTTDPNNIQVEISNNKPVISFDGRWIAFGSNATVSGTSLNPGNFDGNTQSAALASDANTEMFLYQIPAEVSINLSSGVEAPFINLSKGTFTRVTDTPASRPPQAGTTNTSPFVADDNRSASLNDNGSLLAFVSTRDLLPGHNAESIPNPEIFVYNRTMDSFTQVTETQGMLFFNENPTISSPPQSPTNVISFTSNANIPGSTNPENNAEIYYATFNGSAVTGITQVTRTTPSPGISVVNLMSPGRTLSRNGNFITFESTADLAGNGAIQPAFAVFVYNIAANTFTQVGSRATSSQPDLLLRFPTFTGDSSTLIFSSTQNLDVTGAIASSGGLNPGRGPQLFSTPVPVAGTPVHLTRLTNIAANAVQGPITLQAFASNTQERTVFDLTGAELGGGNPDRSTEAFYLLARSGTDATANLGFFTGASRRPVAFPSPAPTPPAVAGLAPGMLGIVISNVALAPSNQSATGTSIGTHMPPLPIELNGVSVSINGAAAGLYFVGNNPSEIHFVVPIGLAPSANVTDFYPLVINNNGTIIRNGLHLIPAQPDIFADASGRAMITNVTARMPGSMGIPEPPSGFPVMSVNQMGQTVPTVLAIVLTGVRNVQASQVTVRIGTTDLTGAAIRSVSPTDAPGFDEIDVQIPSSLAHSCNVPVIVSVTISGQTFTSRPVGSAPITSIGPCP